MKLRDQYDFSLLINEAENIVLDEMERQLKSEQYKDICQCEECILDIAAFALNHLDPAYHSSFTGVIYAKSLHSGSYKTKVEKAVTDAINKIMQNPAHEKSGL